MSKYQVILVIVGVGLVVWLYSLPKIIVKSNRQSSVDTAQVSTPSQANSTDTAHQTKIPEKALSRLRQFEVAFKEATDKSSKIRMADSLASIYHSFNKHDSAAQFKEVKAALEPGAKNYEEAGDMFAEASNFSANATKVGEYSGKARGYYEKVLKEAPDNLDVKSKLAMTYVSSETPMKGILMLREVVEKDPDNQLAIFNLGVLSLQSKQYDKAADRFEKLVKLNPGNWKALFYLGVSYKELGQNDKAREQFELVKIVEQSPEVISIANSYLEELK